MAESASLCVCVWGGGGWNGWGLQKKNLKKWKKNEKIFKKKNGGGVPGLRGVPGPGGVCTWSGGYTWSLGCTCSGGGGGFLVHGGGRCTWSQRGVPGLGVSTIGGVPGPSRGGGVCSRGVYLVLGVYLGVYLVWGAPGGCTWSGTLPHLWTDRRL